MNIPGLLRIPVEGSCSNFEDITLTSFSMAPFTIPAADRYGRCQPVSDFDLLSTVGKGTYSTVYKAKNKASGEIVAIKDIRQSEQHEFMPQKFLREIANLKMLNHENIANLLTVAVGESIESTYLVLDFCEYSLSKVIDTVHDKRRQLRHLLRHPQIKNILIQLLSGLDYIHKHGVFHRDLAPWNIRFTEEGVLKITDFGLSKRISSGPMTPNSGSRWYKAPEILFGDTEYTSSVDIWTAGCIFAEMLRLRVLFAGSSDAEIIKSVVDFLGTPTESLWPGYSRLPIPQCYVLKFQPYNRIRSSFEKESQAVISLLQKTLSYNPSNRPTAEQCLELYYFKDYPLACSKEELLPTLYESSSAW